MRPNDARYRIRAVAEITGVHEATLRAWERRYSFPTPRRTTSGYRLYGEREIAQVRRMRELCESGVSASEAAAIVVRERPRAPVHARGSRSAACDAVLAAIARFDTAALDREMARLSFIAPITTVVDEVILPILRSVGDCWETGEMTVSQEHLATQKLSAVMRDFLRLSPGGDRYAVVAAVDEEQHELGALAVAIHLAHGGMRPIFLGARTPPDALASAVVSLRPAVVALSTTMKLEHPRAHELVHAYGAACRGAPWAIGGTGAVGTSALVRAAGGHHARDVIALQKWLRTRKS
jgi:DNA-binding transcriptional MerR regulator/methylmalonyl-CoA mutase cobalamin-binding subunit